MTPLRLTFPIPPFLQVTWLAKWKDSINGEDKCVWLAANSSWKGKSDLAKYEKARKLKDHIGKVREDYMAGMLSRDPISHTPHSPYAGARGLHGGDALEEGGAAAEGCGGAHWDASRTPTAWRACAASHCSPRAPLPHYRCT